MIDGVLRLSQGIALFLEREAGYIVMSAALIMLGVCIIDPPKRAEVAHDLIVYGLGVMSRSMAGKPADTAPKE